MKCIYLEHANRARKGRIRFCFSPEHSNLPCKIRNSPWVTHMFWAQFSVLISNRAAQGHQDSQASPGDSLPPLRPSLPPATGKQIVFSITEEMEAPALYSQRQIPPTRTSFALPSFSYIMTDEFSVLLRPTSHLSTKSRAHVPYISQHFLPS